MAGPLHLQPWMRWLGRRRSPVRTATAVPAAPGDPVEQIRALERAAAIRYEGSDRNWLRVLPAPELLALLRASRVLHALAKRTNLSAHVWQRDLLPAIWRYAEFVQLVPASESHHHAHAGGLLAHTLEALLAAITWRNGHLLPTGATIEQVDRERDVWTYVVFFAALLHDIGKPMTDLRIQWRTARLTDPMRWTPLAGSLLQLAHGHLGAEYLVEFTPKAARDYGAHSRIALTLLRQIAPDQALALLAQTPAAMDSLAQFLSGHDKTSLVARIVRQADQRSTQRALLVGSKARFGTATSVPLIELMMGALKAMLKSGTELPLNRSGAAGWVYQGSLWLVAKRVADEVRAWIARNAPDESIPGSTKNDRLFDTWQEYGAIERNPQTGQAVWYVLIHGSGSGDSDEAAYAHSLSVLRFPLSRVFDEPSQYPPEMAGTIEVKRSRKAKGEETDTEASDPSDRAREGTGRHDAGPTSDQDESGAEHAEAGNRSEASKRVKAPTFRKVNLTPEMARAQPTGAAGTAPDDSETASKTGGKTQETDSAKGRNAHKHAADRGWSDDEWLIDEDDVRAARSKPHKAAAAVDTKPHESAPASPRNPRDGGLADQQGAPTSIDAIQPVRVARKLPSLPDKANAAHTIEISEAAGHFMQWLLEGLRSGDMAYNQTRALVHFTPEGMALVSPIIFKEYARQTGPDETASKRGLAIQRELIKANLHQSETIPGKGRSNIMRYEVVGRGDTVKATLSAIVLSDPAMWITEVPPPNPALRLAGAQQLTH